LKELKARGKASPEPRGISEFYRLLQKSLEGRTPESQDPTLCCLEDMKRSYTPSPEQAVAQWLE
jgi:hypothetical protein